MGPLILRRPWKFSAVVLARWALAWAGLATLSSCQLGFYIKGGYNQIKLLSQREPIDDVLKTNRLSAEDQAKLELARAARVFAETRLGLRETKNYTTYVQLDRDALTYVVSAAEKWRLQPHLWWFPITGSVPYKGFFDKADAQGEAAEREADGLDTYVRGVSAFSLLGYFSDPIYSPMLKYKPHDLVNTIIHETVHATLYIKGNADFNERLAVFIGNKGVELFYTEKEGIDSPTLTQIKNENADDKIFSEFIAHELKDLENWYQNNTTHQEPDRVARLKEIQSRFEATVATRMLSDSYRRFSEQKLNNARLLLYRTYMSDLGDFETLFGKVGHDFRKFFEVAKSFEVAADPVQALKDWNSTH